MRGLFVGCLVACAVAACGGSTTSEPSGDSGPGGSDAGEAGDATIDALDEPDTGSDAIDEPDTGSDANDEPDTGSDASEAGPDAAHPAEPLCATDADCRVVDDCCTCAALAPGETTPTCVNDCFASACVSRSIPASAALCVAGQCVLDIDCDPAHTLCDRMPPSCAPGEVASVVGSCWGGCVAASECPSAPGCSACGAGDVCVEYQFELGPVLHCVPPPDACQAPIDCACAGPATCTGPFTLCSGTSAHLVCGCPTC